MTEMLMSPEIWASLLTLTALEVVLGIDNIIFLSIITARLPRHRQPAARKIGLSLALLGRIAFLSSITWVIALKDPVFALGAFAVSWRDIILFAGGMFLIYKATIEIHAYVEGLEDEEHQVEKISFPAAIAQIAVLDVVFALDSMITAVGLSDHLWIMITANVIAMILMVIAAAPIGEFINKHPTLKMLALSFLLMVGVALVADGLHFHIPRNYIYFSIAFSTATEFLNILAHKKREKRKARG
jgi:predicted tellurium resistance membrane protein TerC